MIQVIQFEPFHSEDVFIQLSSQNLPLLPTFWVVGWVDVMFLILLDVPLMLDSSKRLISVLS